MRSFWRAAIAAFGASAFCVVFLAVDSDDRPSYWRSGLMPVVLLAIPCFIAVLLYRGMTSGKLRPTHDPETRCRKCAHILRGLSEPRCPECGEKI